MPRFDRPGVPLPELETLPPEPSAGRPGRPAPGSSTSPPAESEPARHSAANVPEVPTSMLPLNSFRPNARRGAARVSVTWMIVVVVLFFVALLFAYVGLDGEAKAKASLEQAKVDRQTAEEALSALEKTYYDLSRAVGFYDTTVATPKSNLDSIAAALAQLKVTFPELKEDVKTLEDALPRVEAAYIARGRELTTVRDQKNTLDSEKATLQASLQEALRQKDQQIADLQRQLNDQSANAAQKQTELEGRIAALNNQRNELDAELRATKASGAEAARGLQDEITTLQVRLAAQGDKLRFLDEGETPDGQILEVSKSLGLGWIDVGAKQRLSPGTSFSVVSGKVGSKRVKAMATVTKVEANRAEVAFSAVTDKFDPPVAGDAIFNPLYDPRGQRNAVLAGRFTGQWNEAQLKALLSEMGITVQKELSLDTDYLIVGSELYADPETGEPLEEPMPVSELAVYKDAEAKGVLILPIRDLRSYFLRM